MQQERVPVQVTAPSMVVSEQPKPMPVSGGRRVPSGPRSGAIAASLA